MDSSLVKKTFQISALKKKINECDKMSMMMKGITALILLVDFMCARKGNAMVVIISLVVLCLFFFLDVYFLKKKEQFEIELNNINDGILKMYTEENQVKFPIGYYAVIAAIMIVWLMKIL